MIEAVQNPGEMPATTRREALTKHAEQLVAQTFYGTLMKQMRDSPFRSELFDGGRGGQAFASMFDQHLAERMSRGAGGQLVQSIVRQLDRSEVKPEVPSNAYENVRIHVAPDLRG